MEPVSMNDGLDGRETIAFGLAASEVAVFVVALLTAYAVVRSGLAGAVAWTLATMLAGGGAVLAWGRLGGRPLLEWAVLLCGFIARTRHERLARVRRRLDGWCAAVLGTTARVRPLLGPPAAGVASTQGGAVVIPLALRRPERLAVASAGTAATRGAPSRSHVVGFVSLAGGSGRTTLAVEVAAILAVRGRASAAAGGWGRQVALLDMARRNPTVELRLGMVTAPRPVAGLALHDTGLLVAMAPPDPPGVDVGVGGESALDAARCAGADIVVVDFDCDPGEGCHTILRRCDLLLLTLTPTASGVLNAYRSTALVRRLGLRERIFHVVNRWRPGVDLEEVIADLGARVVAEIPEDQVLVDAENQHSLAGLAGEGAVAAALQRLATFIETDAGAVLTAPDAPRWGSNAG